MNCTEACPKDLNPAKAIGAIKQLLAERQLLTRRCRETGRDASARG